eukprot:g44968.t1
MSESNKENTFRDTIARRNAARQEAAITADKTRLEVPRSARRPEGHEQLLPPVESVELEPVQSPAKAEELTREQAQRIAERSRWFESTNLNDCPRKGTEWNSPLVQISEALNKDIEVKWQELERIPLRDHKQVPIMPLQSPNPGVNDNGVTERLKKEVMIEIACLSTAEDLTHARITSTLDFAIAPWLNSIKPPSIFISSKTLLAL